ncbi:MAG: hypothetical protein R2695_04250 [Acidimicrobiales bacterium]
MTRRHHAHGSGPPCPRRLRGERGQIGGMEVIPLGLLVLVGITLLLVNVWAVVDAKLAVTAAAREATRAYVESDDADAAAREAVRRAEETIAAYGRHDGRATIGTPMLDGPFARCARVSVTVAYDVPAIRIPFLGGFGSSTSVTSAHSELVDPFRSGIDGASRC